MIPLCQATKQLVSPLRDADKDVIEITYDENGDWTLDVYTKIRAGYRSMWPSYELANRINEMPSVKGHGPQWTVSASIMSLDILLAARASGVEIVLMTPETRGSWSLLEMRAALADNAAERVAKFKATGEVPSDCDGIIAHPDYPLMKHQRVCVRNLLELECYGVWHEPGCGKTYTSIAGINNLAHISHKPLRVLVVCPNQVRDNWASEFALFSTEVGKVGVCRGGAVKRLSNIIECLRPEDGHDIKFHALIVGMDTIRCIPQLAAIEWDIIIVDESHEMINTRTARWAAIRQIRDAGLRRWSLTGTAQRNRVLDYWAQFEFLAPSLSGFRSEKAWKKYYGVWDADSEGHQILAGIANLPMIQELIARFAMVVKLKDVMDLPPVTYETVEVKMSPVQIDFYQRVLKELIVHIEAELESDKPKTLLIQNILVQLLRLSQITGGFINWTEILDPDTGEVLQPGSTEYFPESPKVQAAVEYIVKHMEDDPTSKVIIWSHHRPELLWIESYLRANSINYRCYHGGVSVEQRKQNEFDFNNDPECRVLLGYQRCGGTGLNLLGYNPHAEVVINTDVTLIAYLSQNFSSTVRDQSECRAKRKGQRRALKIVDFVVGETIDTQILNVVRRKMDEAMAVKDVSAMMTTLLGGAENINEE